MKQLDRMGVASGTARKSRYRVQRQRGQAYPVAHVRGRRDRVRSEGISGGEGVAENWGWTFLLPRLRVLHGPDEVRLDVDASGVLLDAESMLTSRQVSNWFTGNPPSL